MDSLAAGSGAFDQAGPARTLHAPTRSRWDTTFLMLVAFLSSTILLKAFEVQFLELLYLFQILLLLIEFARNGGRVVLFRPFVRIFVCFAIFGIAAISLSFNALRYDFYFPPGLSPLKYPVLIAFVRLVELTGNVTMMLYMANIFRKSENALRFTLRLYFWTGIASGVYSLISYPLDVLGIVSLGSYLENHRLRGFYNEGGPYGLYVLSVFLVGFALSRKTWEPRRRIVLALAMMTLVLIMSASKAALVAALFLLLINTFVAGKVAQRVVILCAGFAVVLVASVTVDLNLAFRAYQQAQDTYERSSRVHHGDISFVYGRVAGLFLVPRMIAAHPLAGIGWGNYALVRNSPEYRGASDWAELPDAPSLGLIDLAADFGLPLFAFLLLCILMPFLLVRRRKPPQYLLNLALLQPVVHLFGAQLNLTYPWVITAFGLGLAYSQASGTQVQPVTPPIGYSDDMTQPHLLLDAEPSNG